ncbi:MAG: OsmC family protein [Acidimicrobiales bacterium]
MELLLAAVGTCLTIGWVTHAARRGVELRDLQIEVEGDNDLRGYLGIGDDDRVSAACGTRSTSTTHNEPLTISSVAYRSVLRNKSGSSSSMNVERGVDQTRDDLRLRRGLLAQPGHPLTFLVGPERCLGLGKFGGAGMAHYPLSR